MIREGTYPGDLRGTRVSSKLLDALIVDLKGDLLAKERLKVSLLLADKSSKIGLSALKGEGHVGVLVGGGDRE